MSGACREDLKMPSEFTAYALGVCYASVCTSLPDQEAVRRLNDEHPAGTALGWHVSSDTHFRQGQTNPCPCEDSPDTHRHILMEC